MDAASLTLQNVTKRYGTTAAVADATISIAAGEFFSLLGPSGCGKTTLLRLIGGFEEADAGTIEIGGRDVTRLRPQRRPTAMVFQSYALFPHMSVADNVAYGLKVRRIPKKQQRVLVDEALRRVGMDDFSGRAVSQLSGGQQQRVAVARALAVEPQVLLLDEPLSNLDLTLRERTRSELKELQHRLGLTSVYVTHDQGEALALSDRLAVMRNGRIVQTGTPEGVYRAPETAFVASFLGSANIISRRDLIRRLTAGKSNSDKLDSGDHVIAVRPEHIEIDTAAEVTGRLVSAGFLGAYTELWLDVEGVQLRAHVSPDIEERSEFGIRASEWQWVLNDVDLNGSEGSGSL